MKRIILLMATVVSGIVALGGCSSDPVSTATQSADAAVVQPEVPQSEPQSAQSGPSQEDLVAYFEKLASDDPKVVAEAIELAAPGSNAAAYATYLSATTQAKRDAGIQPGESVIEPIDGGFSMCYEEPGPGDNCFEYTNIQHVGDKIADFEPGGTPLTGRLSLGNGEPHPLGEVATANLIASYKASGGSVVVVCDITSQASGLLVDASYIAPDGRQSQVTAVEGPSNLTEGSFGTYSFFFDGAEYGGQIVLKAYSDDFQATGEATFSIS